MQRPVLLVAGGLLGFGAALLAHAGQARMAVLFLIGGALGLTVQQSAISFAGGWRRWLGTGDARPLSVHLLLLAALLPANAALLARGHAFGQDLSGFEAALGPAFAFGAALFGVGMQLAGGCGSGTLCTAGAGNTRMVAVLAAFIAGSFRATLDQPAWELLPAWSPPRLDALLGWPGALAAQLGVVGLVWLALGRPALPRPALPPAALRGPWSPAAGALLLAGLAALALAVAGHPWGITSAFAVWGAKIARALGWDPAGALAWAEGWGAEALATPLAEQTVSVMDGGLMLGALLGAGLAGSFAPSLRVGARPLVAAILGGLAMGYGARLSAGCNIGAFVSGVASFSLHGWAWPLAALPGCWLGIRLRPRFGLG